MPTITVPKEIHEGEYAIIHRKTYEEFLEWQRNVKSVRTFKPTVRDKRALARARKNFLGGNYVTLGQLRHELGFDN